jgi:Zn-dependent membrane protease YugP
MFYFGWWDIFPIIGFLFALYAQFKLKGLYSKYHEMSQSRGMTGADVAQAILNNAGISTYAVRELDGSSPREETSRSDRMSVGIGMCPGVLTDHYDPRNRILRLSEENFRTSSISAIGVAAHEAGHALQHKEKYALLEMRMSIVGVTGFATNAGMILFMIGLFFHSGMSSTLMQAGIWLYSAIVVFQLITLPVEYDASARAKKALAGLGLVNQEEGEAIRKMLGAAALTYVAALAVAMFELLRMIALANSRDRN